MERSAYKHLIKSTMKYTAISHTTSHNKIAITLFIIVNALFVMKYSERIFPHYFLYITIAYTACTFFFTYKLLPHLTTCHKYNNTLFALGILSIILMAALQYYVDPFSIKVDRWSALHYPIGNLLQGKYPYTAHTHLGGYSSPFPIWQLFHIPFYLMGNVGISFFFCLSIFLFCIFEVYGKSRMIHVISLIAMSPAIWYEAIVRSDLISNMFICASFIIYMTRQTNQEWINKNMPFLSIILALFASTRLITIIPIAMFLFPYFINITIRRQIISILIFCIVFILTFLPFAMWDWNNFFFFEYNPWNLQTRQGSLMDFIIYIPLFFFLTMSWRGRIQLYNFNISIMLVSFILVSILHQMYTLNVWNLFHSYYDITYYNSALPFLMLYISGIAQHNITDKTSNHE